MFDCESEGGYLSDLYSGEQAVEDFREEERKEMEATYATNKTAKVGTIIVCPVCQKRFRKNTYHHVFCSNQKKTGRGVNSCKDRYWNVVNPRGNGRFM